MSRLSIMCTGLICLAMLLGCEQSSRNDDKMMTRSSGDSQMKHDMHGKMHGDMMMAGKTAVATLKPSKAATTQPSNNNVTGTVTFTQMGDSVKVVAHIMGLTPNTTHGFHIHEKGDLNSPDLNSAGGHYNPQGHPHGAPDHAPVHAGDLGNVTSDASGMVLHEITVSNISVRGAKNNIVGRSVIVHSKVDDLKSQPSGDAGGRVAGGIIEITK